jgi:hypothetical protein
MCDCKSESSGLSAPALLTIGGVTGLTLGSVWASGKDQARPNPPSGRMVGGALLAGLGLAAIGYGLYRLMAPRPSPEPAPAETAKSSGVQVIREFLSSMGRDPREYQVALRDQTDQGQVFEVVGAGETATFLVTPDRQLRRVIGPAAAHTPPTPTPTPTPWNAGLSRPTQRTQVEQGGAKKVSDAAVDPLKVTDFAS